MGLDGESRRSLFLKESMCFDRPDQGSKDPRSLDQESHVNPAKDWIWNQTVGYFEVVKTSWSSGTKLQSWCDHAFQKDFTIFYPQSCVHRKFLQIEVINPWFCNVFPIINWPLNLLLGCSLDDFGMPRLQGLVLGESCRIFPCPSKSSSCSLPSLSLSKKKKNRHRTYHM